MPGVRGDRAPGLGGWCAEPIGWPPSARLRPGLPHAPVPGDRSTPSNAPAGSPDRTGAGNLRVGAPEASFAPVSGLVRPPVTWASSPCGGRPDGARGPGAAGRLQGEGAGGRRGVPCERDPSRYLHVSCINRVMHDFVGFCTSMRSFVAAGWPITGIRRPDRHPPSPRSTAGPVPRRTPSPVCAHPAPPARPLLPRPGQWAPAPPTRRHLACPLPRPGREGGLAHNGSPPGPGGHAARGSHTVDHGESPQPGWVRTPPVHRPPRR